MRELGLANEEELQSWFIRQMDQFLALARPALGRMGRDPRRRARAGSNRHELARRGRRHRGRVQGTMS